MNLILLTFALGLVAGLRAFTPLAAMTWAAHWGWIPLAGTPLAFLGSTAAMISATILALGELATDKLPQTGDRTAPPMLAARILLAAFCGIAIFFAAQQSWMVGAIVAALGAIVGTFGGFHLRRAAVTKMGLPGIAAALLEDAIAISAAFLIVSHLPK